MFSKTLYHAIKRCEVGEGIVVLKNILEQYGSIMTGVLISSILAVATAAETEHVIHPETGIHTWMHHDQGVGFTLMQITPDQARAFFLARGFDRQAVDYYASYCVFMTIVRNEAEAGSVVNNLADWRMYHNGNQPEKLKLASDWLKEWQQRGISKTSLIAFEWALFPTIQTFEVGDWNQGMTTYVLPPGSVFDLGFTWRVKGVKHESKLKNVQCAKIEADR